jgi:hypothetical protein
MSLLLDELMDLLDRPKRYSNYIVAMCDHDGAYRPNLFIYEDTYRCSSCGKWGKTEDLLNQLLGKPIIYTQEAFNFRNPFTRWTKDKSLLKVLRSAKNTLKHQAVFRSYLLKRGLDHPTINKLKLGYKDDWYTFPVFDENKKLVGAVARAGEGRDQTNKYVVPQGQDPNLLYCPDWKRLEGSGNVYLTFGVISCISIYLCGLKSLSTLSGHTLDSGSLDEIRKTIVVVPDRHEEEAAYRLANKLGWRGKVLELDYPDDCDDPNDVYMKSPKLLKDLINDRCK